MINNEFDSSPFCLSINSFDDANSSLDNKSIKLSVSNDYSSLSHLFTSNSNSTKKERIPEKTKVTEKTQKIKKNRHSNNKSIKTKITLKESFFWPRGKHKKSHHEDLKLSNNILIKRGLEKSGNLFTWLDGESVNIAKKRTKINYFWRKTNFNYPFTFMRIKKCEKKENTFTWVEDLSNKRVMPKDVFFRN